MALERKTFYYFLLGALLIHATFMVVRIRHNFSSASIIPSEPVKIKIVAAAFKEITTTQTRQIVQSEDTDNREKAEKAFLSDKTRKFDRETISKSVNTFQKAGKGNASLTQPEVTKTAKAQTQKKALKDLKLSDFGMNAADNTPVERSRAPASIKGIENGDLATQGLSATNDYVEEVALGDFTHLNTVEYKHYGFFHRIRQKLEQFWGKTLHEKAANIFRSGRRLPASDNLITSLQVTLNTKGEIVGVKIMGSSGVRELDDAAIESFNEAGPFPNPPKDLLVNGKATIEWGFVVKS